MNHTASLKSALVSSRSSGIARYSPSGGKQKAKRLWLIVLAVWSLVALVHYFQFYLQHGERRPFLWGPTLVQFIFNYYSWVIFAIAIINLCDHFRFRRPGLLRSILVHTTCCATFAALHIGIIVLMLKLFKAFEYPDYSGAQIYAEVFLQLFHFECLVYWVVVGLFCGFEHTVAATQEKHRAALQPLPVADYQKEISVTEGDRQFVLATERIDWIGAADNYVKIHVGNRCYLLREKLHVLESKLDAEQFLRIHRSAIVNLRVIAELRRIAKGRYAVVLGTGEQLNVSRRRRESLQQAWRPPL